MGRYSREFMEKEGNRIAQRKMRDMKTSFYVGLFISILILIAGIVGE